MLPVWKTFPAHALFGESGPLVALTALDAARLQFAHRLQAAHEGYILAGRTEPRKPRSWGQAAGVQRPITTLQYTVALLPTTQQPIHYALKFTSSSRGQEGRCSGRLRGLVRRTSPVGHHGLLGRVPDGERDRVRLCDSRGTAESPLPAVRRSLPPGFIGCSHACAVQACASILLMYM